MSILLDRARLALPFDFELALSRLEDNVEMYEMLLGLFMEQIPIYIKELEEGLGRADYAMMKRSAHTLKTTTSIIGAVELHHWAVALEQAARGESQSACEQWINGLKTGLNQTLETLTQCATDPEADEHHSSENQGGDCAAGTGD